MRIQIERKHLRVWRLSFYHTASHQANAFISTETCVANSICWHKGEHQKVCVWFLTRCSWKSFFFHHCLPPPPPHLWCVGENCGCKIVAVSRIKRSAQLTHGPFVISSIEWIYWACRTKIEINGYRSKSKCPFIQIGRIRNICSAIEQKSSLSIYTHFLCLDRKSFFVRCCCSFYAANDPNMIDECTDKWAQQEAKMPQFHIAGKLDIDQSNNSTIKLAWHSAQESTSIPFAIDMVIIRFWLLRGKVYEMLRQVHNNITYQLYNLSNNQKSRLRKWLMAGAIEDI